jgi:hypothetical protein
MPPLVRNKNFLFFSSFEKKNYIRQKMPTIFQNFRYLFLKLFCAEPAIKLRYYVGFQVHCDSTTHKIVINQTHYISDFLQRFRRLLHSLGFRSPDPTPIYSDNQGAIQLVKNSKYHKRTKHIETKYYLIREKYEWQQINVSYISIKQQLANILTKALPRESFQHMAQPSFAIPVRPCRHKQFTDFDI